ncbi:MAG: hypothetical protein FRX48_09405 [Lasallia pustulata]|uniref:Uncharacterized protein n=1 Tax=Lasallia pustulata TaxID=136370 RepID=A0A5M8PD35_9LECA|nr:MAG: hypothetical protein FRX48_09405 [Lasallia pustulata]
MCCQYTLPNSLCAIIYIMAVTGERRIQAYLFLLRASCVKKAIPWSSTLSCDATFLPSCDSYCIRCSWGHMRMCEHQRGVNGENTPRSASSFGVYIDVQLLLLTYDSFLYRQWLFFITLQGLEMGSKYGSMLYISV